MLSKAIMDMGDIQLHIKRDILGNHIDRKVCPSPIMSLSLTRTMAGPSTLFHLDP
jgi:hypothetical protein